MMKNNEIIILSVNRYNNKINKIALCCAYIGVL